MTPNGKFLSYERARFSTRLHLARRYTAGHLWLAEAEAGRWRVGFTKFALRMLGDPVEFDFEVAVGDRVQTGDTLGWIEGFKAVSDVYAPMNGSFEGSNPALEGELDLLRTDTERAWFFELGGEPDPESLDAEDYAGLLDSTIDRMLAQDAAQKGLGQ